MSQDISSNVFDPILSELSDLHTPKVNTKWSDFCRRKINIHFLEGNIASSHNPVRFANFIPYYCCTPASVLSCDVKIGKFSSPLRWRHNEHDGVSNHQPHDCLLNRLFRRRSKKTSKLRAIDLREGNSPVTGEFPAERANVTRKMFPFDDVIISGTYISDTRSKSRVAKFYNNFDVSLSAPLHDTQMYALVNIDPGMYNIRLWLILFFWGLRAMSSVSEYKEQESFRFSQLLMSVPILGTR